MCRKKKKQEVPQPVIIENEAVMPATGAVSGTYAENDYFSEYYKAYKNDYIDQYLRAYHKFKETGEEDDLVRELQGYDSDFSTEKKS